MLELKETDMIGGDWKHLMIRKCKICGAEKPLDEFVKDARCRNGHSNTCKDCKNKYLNAYRNGNEEYLQKRRENYHKQYKYKIKENDKKKATNQPLRFRCQLLRRGMRERSKKKHYEFDSGFFTVDYLMKRLSQNPTCECCGKTLDIGYKEDKKISDDSPSMDRVDSSRGYTKDNVAIICWGCNRRKQDSTPDFLRTIANYMESWDKEKWGNEVPVLED